MQIALAESDAQIGRCFAVMAALRPHLRAAEFIPRVRRQRTDGYHLAYLDDAEEIRAVAGYRYLETLAWGRMLYVEDLVTAAPARSQGYGGALFDWIVAQARARDCDELHLDSGVQRFDAHRFYLRRRMNITSHHFALKLK